ncbi:MAG: flagellin [Phycisphaerales bacterium]|jgi:flagellin|nr:flagellin [Phycisphaerales bacterium]
MARINSNISSVIAQSNLGRSQAELQLRLERLSTGLRINRGKDDPAGLIISERLRSNIDGVEAGVKNSQRAGSMISTTEAALAEISDLLNSVRSLIVESANTGASSEAERQANQLQIDSAIESITRISNTASFGSLKLLNGSLDYTLSSVSAGAIRTAKVNNASLINQANLQVNVAVVASAQVGALYYNGGTTTPPGVLASAMTLEVAGRSGVQTVALASGISLSQVVTAVNTIKNFTGVEAVLINNNANSGIVFRSTDYGSNSFVSVSRLNKPQNTAEDTWRTYKLADSSPQFSNTPFGWSTLISAGTLFTADRDTGRDVQALINGNLAAGRGLDVILNTPSLGVELTLDAAFATDPTSTATSFYITGGGALFQIGPEVSALQQTNIGIGSVAASKLGGSLVGGKLQYLSALKDGQGLSIRDALANGGDFSGAQAVLGKAIDDITVLRGRLGAFERNVLEPNLRSLQSQFENLTASESAIRDADFAFETSKLTRAQILSSAGTSVLSLANQQSQQVLQLLG